MITEYEIPGPSAIPSMPWSEDVAERIAREDGLGKLTGAHWLIINTLREHFVQYGALPPMRFACDVNSMEPHCVQRLFRSPREAWRVSGLPDPREEAKSPLI